MSDQPIALVVDDEPQMVGVVSYALQVAGFEVLAAYNGRQALQWIGERPIDLIVLDIMMPGMDGWDVCRQIRSTTSIPILMLTAKSDQSDVITGLELGADDYIAKPFSTRELVLRAQAILRRAGRTNVVIRSGLLEIDLLKHTVILGDTPVDLTALEFRLLAYLAKNSGRVIGIQELLKEVWELDVWEGGREMIKIVVHRLRQKIEPDPKKPRYILTMRDIGYQFKQGPSEE